MDYREKIIEACAKVCETEWATECERIYGEECAAAIRAIDLDQIAPRPEPVAAPAVPPELTERAAKAIVALKGDSGMVAVLYDLPTIVEALEFCAGRK